MDEIKFLAAWIKEAVLELSESDMNDYIAGYYPINDMQSNICAVVAWQPGFDNYDADTYFIAKDNRAYGLKLYVAIKDKLRTPDKWKKIVVRDENGDLIEDIAILRTASFKKLAELVMDIYDTHMEDQAPAVEQEETPEEPVINDTSDDEIVLEDVAGEDEIEVKEETPENIEDAQEVIDAAYVAYYNAIDDREDYHGKNFNNREEAEKFYNDIVDAYQNAVLLVNGFIEKTTDARLLYAMDDKHEDKIIDNTKDGVNGIKLDKKMEISDFDDEIVDISEDELQAELDAAN